MLRRFHFLTISLFILFSAVFVSAQNPVSWSLESSARGKSLAQNETFSAKLKANIEGDWHLYAVDSGFGAIHRVGDRSGKLFRIFRRGFALRSVGRAVVGFRRFIRAFAASRCFR